jgi:hypothetical protein
MSDLPSSTVTAIGNNSSALSDTAQSAIAKLTFGINLTPLIWILLAEFLVLAIAGGIYAIGRARHRRKLMINALSQMSEHYTRDKNTRMELQQKQFEEQFHLSPEKAGQLSRQLLENEQTFLSTLMRTLTHWDMRRLSKIHLELDQINRNQLTALASAQETIEPVTVVTPIAPDAAIEVENDSATTQQEELGGDDEEIDLQIPHSNLQTQFVNEQENSDLIEKTYPDPTPKTGLILDEHIEREINANRQTGNMDSGALILDLPEDDSRLQETISNTDEDDDKPIPTRFVAR